jgi:hypothetical protein
MTMLIPLDHACGGSEIAKRSKEKFPDRSEAFQQDELAARQAKGDGEIHSCQGMSGGLSQQFAQSDRERIYQSPAAQCNQ